MTTSVEAVPAARPSLAGRTVTDVMATAPKTVRPTATVAETRASFADDHVHMVLIVASGLLLGTVVRADLADLAEHGDDAVPAVTRSRLDGRLVAGHEPAEQVRVRMIKNGQRRLAVVDDRGVLIGLLCLKRRLTGFCSDADIAARAADRRPSCADPQRDGLRGR